MLKLNYIVNVVVYSLDYCLCIVIIVFFLLGFILILKWIINKIIFIDVGEVVICIDIVCIKMVISDIDVSVINSYFLGLN